MTQRITTSLVALAAGFALICAAAPTAGQDDGGGVSGVRAAQGGGPMPRTPDGTPDFSGFW
jgi:hypothetical protein